jgi:predicted Rossmann-fold nucleotide-binding protein
MINSNSRSIRHTAICLLLLLIFTAAAQRTRPSESRPAPSAAEKNEIAEKAVLLSEDIDRTFDALAYLPPAVSFLGGSRIKDGDRVCETAIETGKMMGRFGVPVCTGGGRGIMEFVPRGFLEGRKEGPCSESNPFKAVRSTMSLKASLDDLRTQAFIIKLPNEKGANPSIEVYTELETLPIRKLALMQNKRGFCFFPGGFGTMDEFYELWDLKCRRKVNGPVALVGSGFWREQLDVLDGTAVKARRLITAGEMSLVSGSATDEPSQIISILAGKDSSSDLAIYRGKEISGLKKDLSEAAGYYLKAGEAVVFLGSPKLYADDSAYSATLSVAMQCAHRGIAMRAGDGGNMAKLVSSGAAQGSGRPQIEAFLQRSDKIPADAAGIKTVSVESTVIHKAFISEKMRALVALPGDVHALSELFGILCLMQNGIIERKPVILLGKSYWTPFVTALRKTMCKGGRMLIAPDDLSLVTVTDSPAEAMALISP